MEVVFRRLRQVEDANILQVKHDHLLRRRERELASINGFLGTALDDSDVDSHVRAEPYHVPSKLEVERATATS